MEFKEALEFKYRINKGSSKYYVGFNTLQECKEYIKQFEGVPILIWDKDSNYFLNNKWFNFNGLQIVKED